MSDSQAKDAPQFPSTVDLPDSVRVRVFVVLAAYNEAACIEQAVREVLALYPHVVVVDDASEDDTGDRASRAGAVVLRHVANRGQGAALQTGIDYALAQGAGFVVTFDGDGQHRADDIAALIAPIAEGRVEIALGSRFRGSAESIPPSRRLLLKGGVVFTRFASGAKVTDVHNGLRAFSRRAAQRIRITLERMAHASELIDQIHASGLPYCEVPVHIRYTEYSRAKGQSFLGAFRILIHYVFGRLTR